MAGLKTTLGLCTWMVVLGPLLKAQLGVPDRPCAEDTLAEFPGSITSSWGSITLTLNNGKVLNFEDRGHIFGAPQRACSLSESRVLLSGDAGARGINAIVVVDVAAGRLVDVFYAYRPTLSPDRRWLIFRRFYPSHGVADPSEQYMIYDLRKASPEYRVVDAGGVDAPGSEVYPVEETFFLNVQIPDDEKHDSRSGFFWSPDSKAVLFADFHQGKPDLVLVKVGSSGHTVLVRPVDPSKLCRGRETPGYFRLESARLTPVGAEWEILAEFGRSSCQPDPLTVNSNEFKPARVQQHRPLPPPAPSTQTDKPPQLNVPKR